MPFLNAQTQLREAFDLIRKDCDDLVCDINSLEYILYPTRVSIVHIPVKMDNGSVRVFKWFRSQHNNARWPFKWWIRFHQNVSLEEVQALSIWMTFKCSLMNIPLWGAKWWIIVNPKELSERELERLSRWYVNSIHCQIWPDMDIPAPDVNTNSKIMWWMVDEYNNIAGKNEFGTFTGKPLTIGGSLWRDVSTSLWAVLVLEKYLEGIGSSLDNKKIIIQWAGNAWLNAAKILVSKGSKIVAISDSKWAIYNSNWLDISKIEKLKKNWKSVISYSDATIISNEQLLVSWCDILIPAAMESQITKDNANNIQASIILELANGPTLLDADKILFKKGINVIPDILANAWGVVVSYFEQVQNASNYYWDKEKVNRRLEKIIKKAAQDVFDTAKKYNTDFRNGAYIISINRVLKAMKDRGILN